MHEKLEASPSPTQSERPQYQKGLRCTQLNEEEPVVSHHCAIYPTGHGGQHVDLGLRHPGFRPLPVMNITGIS